MPSLRLTVSADWVARFDAMIRVYDEWEGPGPDKRTTAALFRKWVAQYARRDIRTYEGNIAAEAVGSVGDPT